MVNMEEHDVKFLVDVKIKINQAVIAQVDDEWKKMFYDLDSSEEIVEHVAYNLLQGRRLSQMDGFADLPDELAVLEDVDYIVM